MRSLPWAALGLTAAFGFCERSARADDCEPKLDFAEQSHGFSTCIDVDNLWARPGNALFFATGTTGSTPAGEVAFGATVGYLRRPFRLELPGPSVEPRQVFVIENALDVTYLFALGVTDRLELTLAAPVTFYQDGAGYSSTEGADEALSRSVMRDPRLGVALTMLQRERRADAGGFALTGRFELGVPLGNGDAFAGARTATFVPAITASYRVGPFEAAAEVGARIRGDAELGEDRWGTQLTTSLGANVVVWQPALLSLSAEAFALPVLVAQAEDSAMLVPAEWLASVRTAPVLSGDLFVQAGAGSSLPFTDNAATSPQLRVMFGAGYAPLALDTDADGVLDRHDLCPDTREDRDGFKDQDGCLDPDNDDDRILDAADRCRDDPETVDGFQDEDGCPDLDDDRDGVPDEEDACRNQPEDKDRVDDQDGCPDLDDDGDGVPDTVDACPTGAEDKDGYNDADGCPDPDNDGDGTPDTSDRCPAASEDRDGFADDDGCPDPDNDLDGALDAEDKCPTQAETLDGNEDDDGCPEPGAKSVVRLDAQSRVVIDGAAKFKPKRSETTPELERQIRLVARLVKGQLGSSVLIVEAYPDRSRDAGGEALGAQRAAAIRRVLVQAGIPEKRITAATGNLSAKRAADAPQFDFTVVRSTEP